MDRDRGSRSFGGTRPIYAAFGIEVRDNIDAFIVDKDSGETTDARTPVEFLREHIEWLGLIIPEVFWEETERGSRAIVTYSRAKT